MKGLYQAHACLRHSRHAPKAWLDRRVQQAIATSNLTSMELANQTNMVVTESFKMLVDDFAKSCAIPRSVAVDVIRAYLASVTAELGHQYSRSLNPSEGLSPRDIDLQLAVPKPHGFVLQEFDRRSKLETPPKGKRLGQKPRRQRLDVDRCGFQSARRWRASAPRH